MQFGAAGPCFALLVALGALQQGSAQTIAVGGSSTLYPASVLIASQLEEQRTEAAFEVSFAGTAGGFDLLCKGAVEVIGASRLATPEEQEECAANEVEYVAVPVLLDAVMIVVSEENDWAHCLTLDEVRRLWSSGPAGDTPLQRWDQLRPGWPSEQIEFFAPGVASGTYSFWSERVVGSSLRTDFFPSEDDRQLAQLVASDPNGTSFFGRAHFLLAEAGLRSVAVDDGLGCIEPESLEEARSSRWPFIRPLFLYIAASAAESDPLVSAFVELFLSAGVQAQLQSAGYLPLDEQTRRDALARFRDGVIGPLPADYGGRALLRQVRILSPALGSLALTQVQPVDVVHRRYNTLLQDLLDRSRSRLDDTR